ncbi:MAG: hypothetical protein N4A76_03680 [Firmicutes bacterium]|jgi:acyl carrier protein|nr:hypothetical protein [Bacillota bacterium]
MKEKVIKVIINSINELNEEFDEVLVEPKKESVLFGEGSNLDSMDFVNLVMILEEKLTDELDVSVSILSEKAFSKRESPFRSVEILSDYIIELMGSDE